MNEKKAVQTHSLPDPIALAKEAWQIYKVRFWTMIGIGIVGILAIIVAVLIIGGIGFGLFFALGAKASAQVILLEVILGIIAVFVIAGLGQWIYGAAILSVVDWKKKEGMKYFIAHSRRFVLPLLITSIIVGLINIGAIALFIIPGLMFATWFLLFRYVMVSEGKSGLLALHTSREYLRGRFWGVLWRFIAVNLPMYVLGLFVGRAGHSSDSLSGLYQLINILSIPFYSCYYYVLLTHLQKLTPAPTSVPRGNKMVYLLLPLLGYLLILGSGIVLVPRAIQMFESLSAGIPGNETLPGSPMSKINPSTSIVYGLTTYYLTNKKFPSSLDALVEKKILTSVPKESKTGLPYRYTVVNDGMDFKLCTPISVKPERCVTSASKDFNL